MVFFFLIISSQSHAQDLNCNLLHHYLSTVESLHFNTTHEIMWSNYKSAIQESFIEFDLPSQIFGINRDAFLTGTTFNTLCQQTALLYQFKNSHIPPNSFYEFLIQKTIRPLDPHTLLLIADEVPSLFTFSTDKNLGIAYHPIEENKQGPFQVTQIFENSPASQADLQVDDLITFVNGIDTSTLSLVEVAKTLDTETDISLVIKRGDQQIELTHLIPATFKRTSIEQHWMSDTGLLYIRLYVFDKDSAIELYETIEGAKTIYGSDLNGILLDLRENIGGYLEEALAMVDMLLDKGKISHVYIHNYSKSVEYSAAMDGMITKAPLFILMDNQSASASEIVISSLQDYGRSLTLGSRSFGKGTAQMTWPMTHSLAGEKISNYQGRLLVTIGILHHPTGFSVQQKGAIPDIEIEDPQMKALETIQEGSVEKKIYHESDFSDSIEAKEEAEPFTPGFPFREKAKQEILNAPQRNDYSPLETSDPQLYKSMDYLNIVTENSRNPRHFGFAYYYKNPIHKLHVNTDLYEPGTAVLVNFKFYKEVSHWWGWSTSRELIYDTYGFVVGNELTLSLQNTDVEKYVTEQKTGFLFVEMTAYKKTKDHIDPLVYSHKTIIEF